MNTVRILIAVLLGVLLATFAIENMAAIEITFLGQSLHTQRIVLIVSVLAIGFLLGKTVRILPKSKTKESKAQPDEDTSATKHI